MDPQVFDFYLLLVVAILIAGNIGYFSYRYGVHIGRKREAEGQFEALKSSATFRVIARHTKTINEKCNEIIGVAEEIRKIGSESATELTTNFAAGAGPDWELAISTAKAKIDNQVSAGKKPK
jgi:hypothetical protein